MDLHRKYGLRTVINARGTFTPLGVSRTPEPVIDATAEALRHFIDIAALQDAAGRTMVDIAGCEWGTVTNCVAAAISLSVAATMTGADKDKIALLPDTTGMNNKVVIPAGHLVDYGHPIEQDIRLAGGAVVAVGTERRCTADDVEAGLSVGGVTALLLVESRLCRGDNLATRAAVEIAHRCGLPVILDGAAQDLRLPDLVATGADLILISAQKYLSAPTAGIVLGRRDLVDAVRCQDGGIGRGMKAGKEAIVGAMAALEYRQSLDLNAWARDRKREAQDFADDLNRIPAISAELVADPTHGPFWRVHAWIDEATAPISARQLAAELGKGDPAIFVFEQDAGDGILSFELLSLLAEERALIVAQVARILLRAQA